MPGVSETQRKKPKAPNSVRLYMLDCGKITSVGATEFGFEDGEIATEMFTPCYLIVHPKGTLMWDTGEIPDSELAGDGSPTTQRSYTVTKPLLTQLAAIGYMPVDIDYLALSHYHNDHVANANLFAESTWLVQRAEHEVMFAAKPDTKHNGPIAPNRKYFGDLEKSETKIIENKDYGEDKM